MDVYNLVSGGGLFVLMGLAWALSADRRRVNWRVIVWGVGLQLLVGVLVFWAPFSRDAFAWLNNAVVKLLAASQAGQVFLFGPLAEPKRDYFVLAFMGLPTIIFFSALMGLLYYWGIMQRIIRGFAWLFTRLMRISGAESLCAASNIFVGIESATTVRPYLQRMTRSEFCTILTAGMATVASNVLALYVGFLKDTFPTIAGHLISASIISAPAAILMSKILLPEDGEPVTLGRHVDLHYQREAGGMEAIINGAMAGVRLVVGIAALLIAVLGLVAVVDLLLGLVGQAVGLDEPLTLRRLLGYVMYPFAVVVGVPPADAAAAGGMIGQRLVETEIPAYLGLAEAVGAGQFVHPRTAVVTAYALCGFAHVASMAVFVGGIAALVPDRRQDLAAVGPRALLAATLACLMTGAVAGVFFHESLTPITPAAGG